MVYMRTVIDYLFNDKSNVKQSAPLVIPQLKILILENQRFDIELYQFCEKINCCALIFIRSL